MEISQYLSVFMDECREHLQNLNQSLLELEHNPDDSAIIDRIFRSAHTLKGASATMGFNKMANLTHTMEDVLSKVRNKELTITPEIINVLFEAVDLVEILAQNIGEGKEEDIETTGVVQDLRRYISAESKESEERRGNNLQLRYLESEKAFITDAVQSDNLTLYHVDVTLDPSCLLKGARVFMILRAIERFGKLVKSSPPVNDLEDEKFDFRFVCGILSSDSGAAIQKALLNISDVAAVTVEAPKLEQVLVEKRNQEIEHEKSKTNNQTVRVDIRKLDDLMNLVGELVINRSRLESLGSSFGSRELDEVVESIGRLTLDLRDTVLKARMVPIETVFSRFPRLVRDLSKDLGKEIDLEIRGGETELDRTVIDEIGDPLVHIIRNSLDHGLESVEERQKTGKPANGRITLNAYQEGNSVIITVADDGRGFNTEKVKQKAIKMGLATPESIAEMTDDRILEYTFLPGFSTAEKVTDISGRGVGMDVVKTKVDALGGLIHISSKMGAGTTIAIRLPLTLAIIQTLIVQIGKEIYAIPTGYVDQIVSLPASNIKYVRKNEVFMLRGDIVPLIRLQDILDTPEAQNNGMSELDVVILKINDRMVGCVVDALLNQRDVVIKSLGGYLGAVKGVAGATILGDGRVALILDIRAVA